MTGLYHFTYVLVLEQSIKLHKTRGASSISSPSMSDAAITKMAHHEHHHGHQHGHQHEGIELHTLIGLSLSFGFIFMLLVDQISGGHSHGPSGMMFGVIFFTRNLKLCH